MFDLKNFNLREMTECGIVIRKTGSEATSMEETAQKITGYLYRQLGDIRNGKNGCALVRLFKTHPYGDLDQELKKFANTVLKSEQPSPGMKCLTLLASTGELPEWNTRHGSQGHKTIPLASEKFVLAFPMVSNLIKQFGLEINQVVEPRMDIILDISQKKYNVFYIPEAAGNQIIPAQDNFVVPFKIKSVLGCGGVFPSGNLFVLIMFTKVAICSEAAELFKTLALDIKLALLPFEDQVFK
ncbi:MAG: hypothetical protein A2096_14850 [Spirochaetes bacterium GWF1_41_5]|nr:MAG: hypothetical protein A2096_14850 [Spirochaetes bacterium GWF1_41_5]